MRDNFWLEQKLEEVWSRYFSDIERLNKIQVHFGKRARRRLASIRQSTFNNKSSDTEIRVTAFYKDEKVPEYVVETTLAHELCHYVHGFASPLPQFSKFPHHGGLVDKELVKRGLGEQLKMQKKWLEENWNDIVGEAVFRHRTRRQRTKRSAFTRFVQNLGIKI
jgi:hypothetical protein